MLAITFACWAAVVRVHHERIQVPVMFWWLAAYGVATVFSALNSVDPTASLIDCKQLVLFLIVPVVYRFARGSRALTFATVIISVGALSALIGIAQFGLLHYDNLSQRPRGSLTHYMTYSGVLMLVACAAAARLVFRTRRRALLRRLADLDGAGDAGADRGPGAHLHPQRVGRAGRRRRRPDRAQGSAAARRHPAGGRARRS